jgi:ABC-type lipoprotein release transport system permease subunit
VAQLLTGLLYGISPTDPISFAGSALLLATVALIASVLPARRAASVNPVEALRAE